MLKSEVEQDARHKPYQSNGYPYDGRRLPMVSGILNLLLVAEPHQLIRGSRK
jgi:hypothetical protein